MKKLEKIIQLVVVFFIVLSYVEPSFSQENTDKNSELPTELEIKKVLGIKYQIPCCFRLRKEVSWDGNWEVFFVSIGGLDPQKGFLLRRESELRFIKFDDPQASKWKTNIQLQLNYFVEGSDSTSIQIFIDQHQDDINDNSTQDYGTVSFTFVSHWDENMVLYDMVIPNIDKEYILSFNMRYYTANQIYINRINRIFLGKENNQGYTVYTHSPTFNGEIEFMLLDKENKHTSVSRYEILSKDRKIINGSELIHYKTYMSFLISPPIIFDNIGFIKLIGDDNSYVLEMNDLLKNLLVFTATGSKKKYVIVSKI